MAGTHPRDVSLARARDVVRRAVDKAEQLGLHGGIAVVGASGALVTASRLDHGGLGGMGRATSKAWISATQQIPSVEHLHRMTSLPQPIAGGFVAVSPQAAFPGGGGLPIVDDSGVVVGGIAASGSTVSPFFPAGLAAQDLSVDGQPANPEDLLIAYALDIPYASQHGDDQGRWSARFGELRIAPEASRGMASAPPASQQDELAWAVALCDRLMAAAAERGLRVWGALGGTGGDPGQKDRQVDPDAARLEVALALATSAARFGVPSEQLATDFGSALATVAALHPTPFLALPGGLPLTEDDRLVGGVGVGGADPATCADLLRSVVRA